MLSKLEELFLGILRLAVVAIAGLVLVVAIGSLVGGAILFGQATFATSQDVSGGDLAGFIRERRLAAEFASDGAAPEGAPQPSPPVAASSAVEHAATAFTSYLNRARANTITKAELIGALNGYWRSIPGDQIAAYDASLLRLAGQIAASRGRPLSRARVIELLEWHRNTIAAEAASHRASASAATASAWVWIVRGGQAFFLFVVIAFYFLLVRVERHLRLVHIHVGEAKDETRVGAT